MVAHWAGNLAVLKAGMKALQMVVHSAACSAVPLVVWMVAEMAVPKAGCLAYHWVGN